MPRPSATALAFVGALAALSVAVSPPGLLCENYAAACASAFSAFNCTAVSSAACGDPAAGVPATLDNFIGTCTCLAPYYFDTPSGRLQEEIWDAAVKSSIGALIQCEERAGGGGAWLALQMGRR
jgi:hypothetical protein